MYLRRYGDRISPQIFGISIVMLFFLHYRDGGSLQNLAIFIANLAIFIANLLDVRCSSDKISLEPVWYFLVFSSLLFGMSVAIAMTFRRHFYVFSLPFLVVSLL